jgi:hypothetical protein
VVLDVPGWGGGELRCVGTEHSHSLFSESIIAGGYRTEFSDPAKSRVSLC